MVLLREQLDGAAPQFVPHLTYSSEGASTNELLGLTT
jgi:hypothetical protein